MLLIYLDWNTLKKCEKFHKVGNTDDIQPQN